jgi:UDP-GlcNAc:undecaprenyl-phosphate GlcNAc-1-phosphate transferase
VIVSTLEFFLLFISSFVLVYILTPPILRFAVSKGVLDRPVENHKTQKSPVPYFGGVAIMLGVIIVTYSGLIFSGMGVSFFWTATSLLGPAVAMGAVGIIDDIRNLHPMPRFISQSLAGFCVAAILIYSNTLGNPSGSIKVDVLLTVLWIVAISNSINFFDNIDGGVAGSAAIILFTLGVLAILGNQFIVAAMSFVVSGANLGFLLLNKNPAKIYMGDTGSLFLGVIISTLTIRLDPRTDSLITSFSVPIILLAIPILDTSIAIFSRLRRRVSIFQGGQDHLSHRLLRSGRSKNAAVIHLWTLTLFFCLISVAINLSNTSLGIYLVAFATLLWSVIFLHFFRTRDY